MSMMFVTTSYPQPPLPLQPSQLWVTLTKQERVVELIYEDEEVDELAGDEGKPLHPSVSPCTHARHTLRSLEGIAMGLLSKIARQYPCPEPGVPGWSASHRLNSCNNSGDRLFLFADYLLGRIITYS